MGFELWMRRIKLWVKLTIIPPPWKKRIVLCASLLFLLIAVFWFSVALYYFDSLYKLDIIYLGALFAIFFLLFVLFLILWWRLRAETETETETEDNKIEVKIPRSVKVGGGSLFFIAFCIAVLAAYQGQWIGLNSILLATAALPILHWRMDLIDKQNKLTNKNIEIQQQRIEAQQQEEYRKNYLDSIKYLESESATLRLSAIQEFGEQLETDEKRHSRIIKILSSTLRKNTIQENDTGERIENKRIIIQTTLDALAKQKPKWFPSDFELDLRNITFNKNTERRIPLDIKNLGEADLRGANFENTDIDAANFEWINFENANFKRATLIRANFTRTHLHGANFEGAKLQEANFTGALLQETNFEGAKLYRANFIKADFPYADFEGADLQNANFTEAHFYGANFGNTFIHNAIFEGADLQNANFTKADLWRANFKQANCEEANFEEAYLCEADLSQTKKITQEQINLAFGGVATKLPPDLQMPTHWPEIKLNPFQLRREYRKWMDDKENYNPRKLRKK